MLAGFGALVAAAAVLSAAADGGEYRDADGRFAVELPAGWRFNPVITDLSGALFLGERGGRVAQAVVKVFAFPQAITLQRFADAIAGASDQEPGFHLRKPNSPVTLARREGLERSFVLRGPAGQHQMRVVDQRLVLAGHLGYLVQCEALADAYEAFAPDFARLFSSLRLRDDLLGVPHRRQRAAPLAARDVAGHWQGGGHRLDLSPGRQAKLDGREGTWRLDLGVLRLSLEAGEAVFEVERRGPNLLLRGGDFGDGQSLAPAAAGGG